MRSAGVLVALMFAAGCGLPFEKAPGASARTPATSTKPPQTLSQARAGFTTHLVNHVHNRGPVPTPPRGTVRLVHYPAPSGSLAAYLSPLPRTGRHPAIIWITGGDYNSIGDVWSPEPATNDQTASQYREAGIVTMYPSLRGGNDNPGYQEGAIGETDDILAAADFLAKQRGVDPRRIYLGGHSSGGTMTLIESEYTDRFRAVFSFGPLASPDESDPPTLHQPGDPNDPQEVRLRTPILWLDSIRSPTFVFEGADEPSNTFALQELKERNTSPKAHFHAVEGLDHFSILAPMNRLIASKIVGDSGTECGITFSSQELATAGQG